MNEISPAYLAVLDTALIQDKVSGLEKLIEDSVKISFIYNPFIYITGSQVIDNKYFRRKCLASDSQLRAPNDEHPGGFLASTFDGEPSLRIGLGIGSKNIFETLEDMLAIGKRDEEPVFFCSLSEEKNKKIMKLHQDNTLTFEKFFDISKDDITKNELEELDIFISENKLYKEIAQTPSNYKEEVKGICQIIKEYTPNDDEGKGLKHLTDQFYAKATRSIFLDDRLKRSYCYRILESIPTDSTLNLKTIFKRLVLDYPYNTNIAKNGLFKFQLHGSTFSEPFGFFKQHNLPIKRAMDFKIERIEDKQFAAKINKLNYDDILFIRQRRKKELKKLQYKKNNQDVLDSYTEHVLEDLKSSHAALVYPTHKLVKYRRITEMIEKFKWVEIVGGPASFSLGILADYYELPSSLHGIGIVLEAGGIALTMAPLIAQRLFRRTVKDNQFEINFKETYKCVTYNN